MAVHDLTNPLRELQPFQHVVWHEIGQELREHYGADVSIRQILPRLTGTIEEETIALETGAAAAIKYGEGFLNDALRRYEVTDWGSHVSIGRGESIVYTESIDHLAWLEEHRDELDWIRHDLRKRLDMKAKS